MHAAAHPAVDVAESVLEPPLGHLVHHGWRPRAGDPLAGLVEEIAHCDGTVLHAEERVFPSGRLDLVVHLDEPYAARRSRGAAPFPATCITGVLAGPMLMVPPRGRARVVAVRLHPAGARALLARPLDELGGRTLDLRDLLPRPGVGELVERCRDARSGAGRIAAARGWLGARLAGRADDDDDPIAAAIAWLERHHGAPPIDGLRARTGRSWARLAAAFRDRVGVTPKRYARILRFRRALTLAHADPSATLSALALAAGYYDQAHMSVEFRALAGLTPGAFRSSARYPGATSVAEARR